MGRSLDRLEQLAFAQLTDFAHERDGHLYPANGSFVRGKRGDASYWYYQGYDRSTDGSPGVRTRAYVGPVGDPVTEKIRRDHEAEHDRYRVRRRLAAGLRRAGLPAPTPFDGAVVSALFGAGIFQAGAVLVGSMAFQSYPGLLGQKLDDALMQTGDVDVARAQSILVHYEAPNPKERLEPLLEAIDPSFTPILDRTHPSHHLGYVNRSGYKIEFLTTVGRKTKSETDVVELKTLGGVSAQPMAFLEFLLERPTRSVFLHDDGVPVVVPDPARYAVHKLIVAHMRSRVAELRGSQAATRPKVLKDISQAEALIEALARTYRDGDIAAAWEDAHRRGPSWRTHLREGVAMMSVGLRQRLEEIVLSNKGPKAWRGMPTRVAQANRQPDTRVATSTRRRRDTPIKAKANNGVDPFE